MKKLIIAAVAALCLLIPVHASTVWTTADYLNVRSSPAIVSNNVIDYAPYGTEFTKVDEIGNWTKIQYDDTTFAYISTKYTQEETVPKDETLYSAADFQYLGVINYNGWRWTWYTERMFPGPGLNIPGRHTDENGYICDENDFLCIATYELAQGTIVKTPFGKRGKVYDTGCPYGTLDVYTSW